MAELAKEWRAEALRKQQLRDTNKQKDRLMYTKNCDKYKDTEVKKLEERANKTKTLTSRCVEEWNACKMAKEVNQLILKDSRQLRNNIVQHNLLSNKSEESIESYWSKPVTCKNNEASPGFQVNGETYQKHKGFSTTKEQFTDPARHYDNLKDFAIALRDEDERE